MAVRQQIDPGRIHPLREGPERPGPILYWMSRDQRADDNWALLHARARALGTKAPLGVVFCLVPDFLGATERQYAFMLRGLAETETRLRSRNIPFFLLRGAPGDEIPRFVRKTGASRLVTDFDPLRVKRAWREEIARKVRVPFDEVDAHNIVPCRVASPKREFGAYTIRPRIHRQLPEYLTTFPRLPEHPVDWPGAVPGVDWKKTSRSLRFARSVPEVPRLAPGTRAAKRVLRRFLDRRLWRYAETSNDPNAESRSELSPYLHFGQIAPQRVALAVQKAVAAKEARDSFLEELIVRRELADNFCWYAAAYDTPEGYPDWAKTTLAVHRNDPREYLYGARQLENAETHDPLWNAAQQEMVKSGTMHSYMRMYWAKKILEWTASPEEAHEIALALNDRYELDGRDPNGYAGVAWAIGGVHDRAWPERPVFGKIRFMNESGCRRKFDVKRYIRRVEMM